MQPSITDIAFASGIWQGEGSTAIYVGGGPLRNSIVYAISVNQKRPLLLEWLKERFGGGIYQGYGEQRHSRPCGEWRATGEKGYNFLKLIRPYLVDRTAEVDVMLEAWEKRSDRTTFLNLCAKRKEVRLAA